MVLSGVIFSKSIKQFGSFVLDGVNRESEKSCGKYCDHFVEGEGAGSAEGTQRLSELPSDFGIEQRIEFRFLEF